MTRFSGPGWRASAGILVSALLFALYAQGGNAYVLGFVVLAPWLWALDRTRTVRGALGHGAAMSIAFVAAALGWFGVAIATYLGTHPALGLSALLVAAPILQPQFLAFALVRQLVGRRHGRVVRAFAGAAAWVATEWLAPKLLGDTLGHGLYPSHLLRQVADLGGAAGLTFLLILVNEAIVAALAQRRDGARAWAKPLASGGLVVVAMASYGAFRWSALTAPEAATGAPLRVGMVQSNIVDYERLRREMGAYAVVRHVLDTHYAMSREAVEQDRVDALLWSETVYPTTFGHAKSEAGAELDQEILSFAARTGVPLVFGTYDLDANGEYNAAAFISPNSGLLGFYRKTRLFLFTEYVPTWLDGPGFRARVPWAGGWRPGDGARVFPLRLADGREVPVATMICLDDVDTGLAIEGARQGAQALVGLSNDSWFTHYPAGARLHLAVAAFRSIETRLPQVRVTNNGHSAAIDATGTLLASTAMDERRLLVGEIHPAQPPATLMVRWGDWVGRAGFALLLLLALRSAIRAFRERRAQASSNTDAENADATRARIDVTVLSPLWRIAAALAQTAAGIALLWLCAQSLFGDGSQTNALASIRSFAALVLAPTLAAWAIARAGAGVARIEGDSLVVEQRERRTEIPLREIAAVEPWRFPVPNPGLWLRLASGRRWAYGLAGRDIAALDDLLRPVSPTSAHASDATHATSTTRTPLQARATLDARARAAAKRNRWDHPLLKFGLFALVPALPAFRLHQVIAYGGTFGEYHTYGLKAYLLGLALWWATWAINLAMFAAVLRALIEASAALTLAFAPARAIGARSALESAGRLLFYIGVPALLLIRLWPS